MYDRTTPWSNMQEVDFYSPDYAPSQKRNTRKDILSSPKKIYDYLDSKVFMMEEAKKALSMFVYKAITKNSVSEKVLLLAGESGTGKSHLISVLSEIIPLSITDGASLVPQGYKGGNHVTTILNQLDVNSDAPCHFLVIDEFNRTLQKGTDSGSWAQSSLLSELLVLFDDKDVKINASTNEFKPLWVTPSKLFWILLGSFSDITDKKTSKPIGFNTVIDNDNVHRPQITKEQILESLKEWPELVGRISRIVACPNWDIESYYKMLKSPKYSIATRLEKELGISIKIAPKKMRQFAKDSYESGTGVRGIKNAIIEEINEALFNDPSIKEIYIK